MKKDYYLIIVAALLISACAHNAATVSEGVGQTGGTTPAIQGSRAAPLAGDHLDAPAFAALPREARTYLAAISRAFRNQDAPFLLAQGERNFENEVRPRYDDETYLAMLYRSDSYATDASWEKSQKPRLVLPDIREIEYINWEEQGPMLAIQGRFDYKDGSAVPCKIILAWRLTEPKILGVYP
ncbi:hypothetical protein FACS1894110_09090 [Spirochaetia bacterium]|nr:hypothetical protein FACS1894110_09090 [Spirochaetia bacterium]